MKLVQYNEYLVSKCFIIKVQASKETRNNPKDVILIWNN